MTCFRILANWTINKLKKGTLLFFFFPSLFSFMGVCLLHAKEAEKGSVAGRRSVNREVCLNLQQNIKSLLFLHGHRDLVGMSLVLMHTPLAFLSAFPFFPSLSKLGAEGRQVSVSFWSSTSWFFSPCPTTLACPSLSPPLLPAVSCCTWPGPFLYPKPWLCTNVPLQDTTLDHASPHQMG